MLNYMSTKIKCEPLSLDHQPVLSSLWEKLCVENGLQFAEYSFSNNFLFRRKHNFMFVATDPPFLRGEFSPNQYYYIPTMQPSELKQDLLSCFAKKSASLYPIPEHWLGQLEKCHPTISSCRADSDYMFTSKKLKTLSGRELSSRRNLLHQLLASHQMETKPLKADEFENAMEVLDAWQANSKELKENTDYFPCKDSLTYLDQLGLFGRIAFADGRPVGFTVGDLLNSQTAVLLMAKSLHDIKGLTPYLYQDFALSLPDTIDWINLEQDLGLSSLRRAKEAYAPDALLQKWKATF